MTDTLTAAEEIELEQFLRHVRKLRDQGVHTVVVHPRLQALLRKRPWYAS